MHRNKIVQPLELASTLRARQQAGRRVVFTNGCFDLLHVGHIRYLQAARNLGDLLVVAVNSDASVQLLSKSPVRPIIPQAQRMEVLAALASVDYVVLFSETTPLETIEMLQPDVLVKGGDWSVDRIVGREIVESRGGMVCSIPLVPDISTSIIIQRIQQS
jgi:rfaE bifunctional protein nucleotidyltransferase chain/domain